MELQKEIFTNSKPWIRGFQKCGANLISDLLIFVYWPIFYLKKSIFGAKNFLKLIL